jgi:hypothetical protein
MGGAIGGAAITADVAADVAVRFGEFAAEGAFEPFGGKAEHLGSDAPPPRGRWKVNECEPYSGRWSTRTYIVSLSTADRH